MAFEDLKVVELKAELRERGLPVSGVKAILIQRLQEHNDTRKQAGDNHDTGGKQYVEGERFSKTDGAKADNGRGLNSTAGGAEVGLKRSGKVVEKNGARDETEGATSSAEATNGNGGDYKAAKSPNDRGSYSSPGRMSYGTRSRGDHEGVVGSDTRLAALTALLGIAVSVACTGGGEGLTTANLISLNISLAALLIVGRAANSNLHGLRAMGIRILATAALCYALYDAIRQLPLLEQDSPEAENSFGPAEAETSNMEIGTSCKALAGGDEEGGADSSSLCLTPEAADAITAKFGSRWLADMVGGAMYDGGDSSTGSWLETKFAVVQFWGLTSVVAYLALVEALPVLLRPLHVFVRMLERMHNVLLAVTSLGMLIGVVYSTLTSGKTSNLNAFLCKPYNEEDKIFLWTSNLFFWSKMWEWFDTALLVAKGKPVTWLHYTHHASTAILTSFNMVPKVSASWSVVCASNSFVHAWMYAYYAFPRIGLLRRLRVWLTRAQIVQHVSVLASAFYVVYQINTGKECYNEPTAMYIGLGLYLMYLIFFGLFYRRVYGKSEKKRTHTG